MAFPRFQTTRLAWLVVLAVACLPAIAAVFPGTEWEARSPESQGVSSAELDAAIEFLKTKTGGDGVRELFIVRNGYVIWQGASAGKVHGVWSCTKSFTSTCLGLLIDDGKCSIDSRAAEFVADLNPHYADVTLRHFTTMTSGYRAVGDEPKGSYTHGPSSTPFTPNPEPLFAPGSKFAYWDSAMNEFGLVLTEIAGEPLEDLFGSRVANVIQMDPSGWRWNEFQHDDRTINGGAGNNGKYILINAREMARFGWLFLNEGKWKDQQVISSNWVRQATSVQVPASTPPGHSESDINGPGYYGFNWWVNGVDTDGKRKWPGAPESTFASSGFNNNDMFVIPDWNMVIARLGLDQNDRAITDEDYGGFLRMIGEALDRVN